jgi:hypothetical protein
VFVAPRHDNFKSYGSLICDNLPDGEYESWNLPANGVRVSTMIPECWMPAHLVAEHYAVSEATLLRYGQRGMIGARWDEETATWCYDAQRVRELFLLRVEAARAVPRESFGILGEARLVSGQSSRRLPVDKAGSTLRDSNPPRSMRRAS